MNKKSIFAAVAIACACAGISRAAVDDDGMSYVSASEGLSGSIRIRFFDDSDDPERIRIGNEDQPEVNFGDSRLSYRGESDMGSGVAVTYYLEIRPRHEDNTTDIHHNDMEIEYIDAGVRGFFGHFRVGNIESVSSAMVPSADRSNDAGTTGRKLADSYNRGGLRWISPDIRGIKLGLSTEMEDVPSRTQTAAANDKTFDQYDLAVTYNFQGADIGGSYAIRPSADGVDSKGFRMGVKYEGSNWGLGYNYHYYRSFVHDELNIAAGISESDRQTTDSEALESHEDTKHKEHVLGANVTFSRLNLAVTHSRLNLANETNDFDKVADLDFKETAVDVSFRLGAKSQLIAAYTLSEDNNNVDDSVDKTKGYYIMLRTDF